MKGIKECIKIHREEAKEYTTDEEYLLLEHCPFVGYENCLPCLKLFPIMKHFIDYIDGDMIRTEHPETDTPNCPCHILGKENVTKRIAILMGD